MQSFFKELGRRNVIRVGAAYLVVGWLIIQVTDTVAPALGLPPWTLPIVIWISAIGLPIALLFAWAFELTPDGIKRTEDVTEEESIAARTGGKLNTVILVVMAAAIGLLLVDRFVAGPGDPEAETASVDDDGRIDSVAVLPFSNLSEDPGNQYFGDGLAEEILNLLAGVDGLTVAARTSSFYFKDKNPTMEEVTEALGVDSVVEGTVRRSGDTIRVTVSLVSAATGAELWSERYERPLTDLFVVQDDISSKIVAALGPHLGTIDAKTAPGTDYPISPANFERFMQARARYYEADENSMFDIRDEFLGLTKLEPGFAPAWAWLARSWVHIARHRGVDESVARAAAVDALATALALDADEPMAYLVEGQLFFADDELDAAIGRFDRALELDPNLVDAYINKQYALAMSGQTEAAIDALEKARSIDPLHTNVVTEIAHLLNLQGRIPEAFAQLEKLESFAPTAAFNMERHLYTDRHEYARSAYLLERSDTSTPDDMVFEFMALNLHTNPAIQQTRYRAVSLAVLGQEEDARRELEEIRSEIENVHEREDITALTYVALGDIVKARDELLARWNADDDSLPPLSTLNDKRLLAATLAYFDEDDETLEAVLAEMRAELDDLSPLHAGSHRFFSAYLTALEGKVDESVEHFRVLIDDGDPGYWFFGTAFLYPWVFEDEPRYDEIAAGFEQNRDRQVALLEHLRATKPTRQQVRREYLELVAAR